MRIHALIQALKHTARAAGIFALAMLSGCVTTSITTNDGRPLPPEPRALPRVPAGSQANKMAVWVGAKPLDTNGNGYPDMIPLEAYLFADPNPSPMFEDGAIVVSMYKGGRPAESDTPFMEWRVAGQDLENARLVALAGPAYGLELSLLEQGGDEFPLMGVNLACRFEPADGRPAVRSGSTIAIQIGRRQHDRRDVRMP